MVELQITPSNTVLARNAFNNKHVIQVVLWDCLEQPLHFLGPSKLELLWIEQRQPISVGDITIPLHKISTEALMAEETKVVSALPLPPAYYKLFAKRSEAAGAEDSTPAKDLDAQKSPAAAADAEINLLEPPPLPSVGGAYNMYGTAYKVDFELEYLLPREQILFGAPPEGTASSSSDLNLNFKDEMRRLLDSVMANYAQLLDVLMRSPSLHAQKAVLELQKQRRRRQEQQQQRRLPPQLERPPTGGADLFPTVFSIVGRTLLDLLGSDRYLPLATVNRAWRDLYATSAAARGWRPHTTSIWHVTDSAALLGWALRAQRWPRPCLSALTAWAAARGRVDALECARAAGCCPWTLACSRAAARNGHLRVVQWAARHGCPKTVWTCADAAGAGHLSVVAWAHDNGFPWGPSTCEQAAESGELAVLQWARARGCPWDVRTAAAAAKAGNQGVLEWARRNGCPWNEAACVGAAEGGHLRTLQWLRENGCPWDAFTMAAAARRGHLEVLRWARENGAVFDDFACCSAAAGGQLAALQWLRAESCEWHPNTCRGMAATAEVRDWIDAHAAPLED
ncbi:hypothetical protein JKP88DRAFT_290035 [Tribonema minus]|uniref:Uncharacterized protein n=1 Tax=Tribonema minus TaxID=303371 RepID=A0A835YZG8_9STRA|nr:hypothetical protein JKP88DRAFT_290035 [Tribonema minus]